MHAQVLRLLGPVSGTTMMTRSFFSHAHSSTAPYARLIPSGASLAFETSYDRGLVDEFKRRVPPESRSWDAGTKRWLVDPAYGDMCAQLAFAFLGVQVAVPAIAATPTVETKLIKLEYLGRTKDRGNGESSAYGYADGGWTVILSEQVLRDWFQATPQSPTEKPTLYAALGIKATATSDELKAAYRRLVKIWHPDVNRGDPDAPEQFKAVQHAYEILSDGIKRRKYDAGLALQASLQRPQGLPPFGRFGSMYADSSSTSADGYRAPLKCGWVLTEGKQILGRFSVSKIIGWEDVVDAQGRTMVTCWPKGAETFAVVWQ